MAEKFPLFEEDMDIIQKLGDTPGTDNNMDWQELQAEFDKGGNLIKAYLNELAAKLNGVLGAEGVFLSGGNLMGDINANQNRIYGLKEPTEAGDAANKKYVDDAVSGRLGTDGGELTGPLGMSGNRITGVAAPTENADAATKEYVDAMVLKFQNVTVPASAWASGTAIGSGDRSFYANVALDGVTESMFPHVVFRPSDNEQYDFSGTCQAFNGLVQIYAGVKPTVDITILSILTVR